MSQYLLTFLQSVGDDYLRWAVADEQGSIIGNAGHGTFADAAAVADRKRVVMVVSGTAVLLEEVEVPATNLAKALKAVPYSLEEQLAQDVEASHFAFGSRLANGSIPVAVIARSALNWIQEMSSSVKLNLQEIVPETLALPLYDDNWTVMTNQDHSSVRLSSSRGFSCDTDMLVMLLSNAIDDATPEQIDDEVHRARHFSCGKDDYRLNSGSPEFVRTEVALFAQGLSQYKKSSDRINLLQGDFGKTEALGKAWKPWRLPAALAATLAVVWGGSTFLQFQSLGLEEDRLQSEIVSTLKTKFPSIKSPEIDPVRKVRSQLKANTGVGIDDASFVMMMSAVGSALNKLNDPLVSSINYKRGQLDLVLEANTLQEVDKLKSSLEIDAQLSANVQSATKEQDRIKARVRVEAKS